MRLVVVALTIVTTFYGLCLWVLFRWPMAGQTSDAAVIVVIWFVTMLGVLGPLWGRARITRHVPQAGEDQEL